MREKTSVPLLAMVAVAAVVTACSGGSGPMMMGNTVGPSTVTGGVANFTSNGQRIYFTATSASAAPITYTGGIEMPMRLACVNCHGPAGYGGASGTMMGLLVQAPNITWPALTGPDPDHAPYTEDTVKAAITKGVNPSGAPLESPMPRWSMTAADLDDLVKYLETLR